MNVHLLEHLTAIVKKWGPLWVYSCFHYENMNGCLKYLFHGTKEKTKQVYLLNVNVKPTSKYFADGIFVHNAVPPVYT